MTAEFQQPGISAKRHPGALHTVASLVTWLTAMGRPPLLDSALQGLIDQPADRFVQLETLADRCDLALAVGGDGTLLAAARVMAPKGVPILGINQGRLGFMVDVTPAHYPAALSAVFDGQYIRENRLLLNARIDSDQREGQTLLAVNDVVLRNLASIRMLEFETWQGEQFIGQHRADGLIVSTPTGSTAYALSSGGPVIHPALDALALVPICPHTLSDRPLVMSADQPIRVRLQGGPDASATVTCDGQTHIHLAQGESVVITRAPFRMHLIHAEGYGYYDVLRNKLHWGHGPT